MFPTSYAWEFQLFHSLANADIVSLFNFSLLVGV